MQHILRPETVYDNEPIYKNTYYNVLIYRNPTPTQDPELNVTWNPVIASEMNYLDIDKELSMKKHLAENRLAFWKELESSL